MSEAIVKVSHDKLAYHVVQAALSRKVLFIHGLTGIGKSQSLFDTATKMMGIKPENFHDLRVANMDPVELRGYMFPNKETKRTETYAPSFLPDSNSKELIMIVLEEMTSVNDPLMQATLYQLTHDFKVGEYVIPENVIIVATGNMAADEGITFAIAGPLNNRMRHVELVSGVESMIDYADKKGFHILVRAFLQHVKDSEKGIHRHREGDIAFMTNRSLEDLNKLLCEKSNEAIIKAKWGVDRPANYQFEYVESFRSSTLSDLYDADNIENVKDAIQSIIGITEGLDFIEFVEQIMKVMPVKNAIFGDVEITDFSEYLPEGNSQISYGQFYALVQNIGDTLNKYPEYLTDKTVIANATRFIIQNNTIEQIHQEIISTAIAGINKAITSKAGGFTLAVNRLLPADLKAQFRAYTQEVGGHISNVNEVSTSQDTENAEEAA